EPSGCDCPAADPEPGAVTPGCSFLPLPSPPHGFAPLPRSSDHLARGPRDLQAVLLRRHAVAGLERLAVLGQPVAPATRRPERRPGDAPRNPAGPGRTAHRGHAGRDGELGAARGGAWPAGQPSSRRTGPADPGAAAFRGTVLSGSISMASR